MSTPTPEHLAADGAAVAPAPRPQPRRLTSRVNILIRRVHLYSGLFLLPWVIMYGVTGAMFNHLGLFPRVVIQPVESSIVADSPMQTFPTADQLAMQVVKTLQLKSPQTEISLAANHGASFTNDLMFEMKDQQGQHVVHIDPVSKSAWIGTQPKNEEEPQALLTDISNISLNPDPHDDAQQAASQILQAAGLKTSRTAQPLGWTKLNFLADVDGQTARVTYVLKDGHVDINRYTGEDGMPLRQFFLRMHTSHGQPPHWNGRMFWSLAVDTMAIAMVCWGVTGGIMWWQLKRTRIIGTVVIALSVLTALALYFSLHEFYATTRL